MQRRSLLLATAFAAALPMLAVAQNNEASQAFMHANDTMMQSMGGMQMSGNPDMDFAMMMIPHHQGAIDMAKVELQYGTDPQLRAMAEEIITAQEAEIATLQNWMKMQGH